MPANMKNQKQVPKENLPKELEDLKLDEEEEDCSPKESESTKTGLSKSAKKRQRQKAKKQREKEEQSTQNTPPAVQTDPPTIPISQLYPDGNFPMGEWQEYGSDGVVWRSESGDEMQQMERLNEELLKDVRHAAEVHRTVRKFMMKDVIKPGVPMIKMCETLEDKVRSLIQENGLEAGIAFPTGIKKNTYFTS